MEDDEIEMTKGELQKWIRGKVEKNKLILDMTQTCNLLQSVLERKKKQAGQLQKLYQSVEACEELVKKQYSLMGWEYRETKSEDGNACPSPHELVHPETRLPRSQASNGPTPLLPKLEDNDNLCGNKDQKIQKRKPVVVLTRLSLSEIRSFLPPTSLDHNNEEEFLNNSSSDTQWEPDTDSEYIPASKKRRKMDNKYENCSKSPATPQASPDKKTTSAKKKEKHAATKSKAVETSTPKADENREVNKKITSTLTKNPNEIAPAIVSKAIAIGPNETRNIRPNLPEVEIKVDTMVLARRNSMRWQRGKILAIVTRKDGKMKYKVAFDENGKSLVSGHHIAFDTSLKLGQVYVGARVVVGSKDNNLLFCPGILAELPSRKNHSRFLVFLDDHKPLYVGLPLLHLVCRPLENTLDDIPDGRHQSFMTNYLKDWPFIHLTQYKVGHILNAELNGVQQKCEVQVIDSSLMEVVFQDNQKKDWLHRGSMRLEHMTRFLEVRNHRKQKNYSSLLPPVLN